MAIVWSCPLPVDAYVPTGRGEPGNGPPTMYASLCSGLRCPGFWANLIAARSSITEVPAGRCAPASSRAVLGNAMRRAVW